MSGLLMIFALLLIVTLLQLTEAAEQAKRSRIIIIQTLEQTLKSAGINTELNPETGDISILDSVLFDSNEADLKPAGKQFLLDFVPIYSRTLFSTPEIADQIVNVVIEGHTSSEGDRNYNMWLSLRRSNSVYVAIDEIDFPKKAVFQNKIITAGRGEADANQTEDLAKDRKVVFRFQFKGDEFLQWFRQQRGI